MEKFSHITDLFTCQQVFLAIAQLAPSRPILTHSSDRYDRAKTPTMSACVHHKALRSHVGMWSITEVNESKLLNIIYFAIMASFILLL